MKKREEQRAVNWLAGITVAAVLVLVWGALFLISPVWQWPVSVAAYLPPNEVAQLIDINTATAEELISLPEIGPERAAAVVAYREENGPFTSLKDLEQVSGISARMIELWTGVAIAETALAPYPNIY